MKDLTLAEQEQPNDCDFLIGKLEHTLDELENCFDAVADEKRTKMNVVGSIFSFGASLTKLTFNVAGCAIKNTPKAIVTVAAVKREIVADLESEYKQFQKELKEEALNEKIRQLQLKA